MLGLRLGRYRDLGLGFDVVKVLMFRAEKIGDACSEVSLNGEAWPMGAVCGRRPCRNSSFLEIAIDTGAYL